MRRTHEAPAAADAALLASMISDVVCRIGSAEPEAGASP